MVVAVLGHGEIHFHSHFEFHLGLILYFTLNCISILVWLNSEVVLFLQLNVLLNSFNFASCFV